jgi:hypothetical protein
MKLSCFPVPKAYALIGGLFMQFVSLAVTKLFRAMLAM